MSPDDYDLGALNDRSVAVIGYGSQGRAHARNMRDSGLQVVVGQRPGKTFDRAVADGFAPQSVSDVSRDADLIILTLPDESAADIYAREIAPNVKSLHSLGVVHGFNVRYRLIVPPENADCIMVAPKGPGDLLRSLFEEGKGLPTLLAVEQDASGHATHTAMAWAHAIGSTRAAILRTTCAAETEADLFGEQVVLCGGVTALMKAAYETLVESGIAPELAYIECIHELKQVVDLIYTEGISGMRRRVSNTAEFGDLTRGPRIVDDHVRANLRAILDEIASGRFAREWIDEYRSGMKRFDDLYERDAKADFERVGQSVRALMPWLKVR